MDNNTIKKRAKLSDVKQALLDTWLRGAIKKEKRVSVSLKKLGLR